MACLELSFFSLFAAQAMIFPVLFKDASEFLCNCLKKHTRYTCKYIAYCITMLTSTINRNLSLSKS